MRHHPECQKRLPRRRRSVRDKRFPPKRCVNAIRINHPSLPPGPKKFGVQSDSVTHAKDRYTRAVETREKTHVQGRCTPHTHTHPVYRRTAVRDGRRLRTRGPDRTTVAYGAGVERNGGETVFRLQRRLDGREWCRPGPSPLPVYKSDERRRRRKRRRCRFAAAAAAVRMLVRRGNRSAAVHSAAEAHALQASCNIERP